MDLHKIGDAVGKAAEGAKDAAKELGQGAKQAAGDGWHAATAGASTAMETAKHAAADVAQGVSKGAHDISDGVAHGDVLGGLSRARQDVAHGAGEALSDGWHGTETVAGQVYHGLDQAVVDAGAGVSRAYDAGTEGVAKGVTDIAGKGAGQAVRTVAGAVAEPVRQMAQFQHGVSQGVAEGAGSLVSGVGDIVVGGVRMGSDSEYRDKLLTQAGGLATQAGHAIEHAVEDPAGTARSVGHAVKGVVDGVVQDGAAAAREGRLSEFVGHAVGRVGFEVAAVVVPGAEELEVVGNAGRLTRVAELGVDAIDTARAAELARAGEVAKGAEVVGDGAKVEALEAKGVEAAGKETDAAKALETKPNEVTAPDEAAAKAKADIDTAMTNLRSQGHGPQRHEGQVTPQQLEDRVVQKLDPETGTRLDKYRTRADGTPANHKCGDHATKVNSEAAYVKAELTMRQTEEYKAAVAEGRPDFAVSERLETVYGEDYKAQVSGRSRVRPWPDQSPAVPTDFTDGTMQAIYRRDAAGNYNLVTMYPEPKP